MRSSHVRPIHVTSTGIHTVDDLLVGHAGLALGNSILIEENETTDFAKALLRYSFAENIVQGYRVHVVRVGQQWGRELSGLVGTGNKESEAGAAVEKDKIKITWRYKRLRKFEAGAAGLRGGIALLLLCFSVYEYIRNDHMFRLVICRVENRLLTCTAIPTRSRNPVPSSPGQFDSTMPISFFHSFDPFKRLIQTTLASSFWCHYVCRQFSYGRESFPLSSPIHYSSYRFLSSQHQPSFNYPYSSILGSFPAFS